MPIGPLTHSVLSASGCERWWNCPGSIRMCADYEVTPSKYMAEGTVAHGLASDALINKWSYSQLEEWEGETVIEDDFEIKISGEMIECVWGYVSCVRGIMEANPASEVYIEEKIKMPEVHLDLFATPDCVIVYPYDTVFLIDLKYGAGKKVDVRRNKQLMYYALYYALHEDVTQVSINIYQPRVNKEEPVATDVIEIGEMMEFSTELRQKANAALKPDAPLHAGTWCKGTFCPAFGECKEAMNHAKNMLSTDFKTIPSPDTLPIPTMKRVLDNAAFVIDWIGQVKERAKALIAAGQEIPGYKIVQGKGNRKWSDEKAVISDFEEKFGNDIYEDPKLKSPAKLEKLIGKEEVAPYTMRPNTGEKLVQADTPGEEINRITVENAFN